jgi:hypothetical protein
VGLERAPTDRILRNMEKVKKTPKQRLRSLRARASANRRWALATTQERREITVKALETFWGRLEATVDPDSVMSPEERHERAVQLWRSRMDHAKADRLTKKRKGAA